jgi:hypothetical protein
MLPGSLAGIGPDFGVIINGPISSTIDLPEDLYTGFSGPATFGSGLGVAASSGTGDLVGMADVFDDLIVPTGYVSGTALSDSATYDSATFASLGATPGTYKWKWGSGANADSFTLQIGPASVIPEPSTWAMMLLGFAGLGLAGWRHRGTTCNV